MPSKRDVRNHTIADPQYAYLGLHQAAYSGNVGLVQYALSEGQPVDAVWDGISALHAAAAGGSEHVARLLIDNGADINLGRQPKNERELKARTASSSSASPPIDKPSDMLTPPNAADALLNPGSTPLHFACAHNNAAVARLLLACGAAPHIPDKYSVTPVELLPPASSLRPIIREYYENEKAKEKEYQKSQIRFYGKAAAVLGFPRSEEDGKRERERGVAGRRSMEHMMARSPKQGAAAQLTSPKHGPVPLPLPLPIPPPPPSPRNFSTPTSSDRMLPSPPSLGYTFGTASATPTRVPTMPLPPCVTPPEHRRPSLPHIFESPTASLTTPRTPASTATSYGRPRSADGTDSAPFGNGAAPHNGGGGGAVHATTSALPDTRPRTKRSLLSLFKKMDCPSASDEAREKEKEKEKERELERELARGKASPSPSMFLGSISPHTHKPQLSRTASPYREEVHTAPAERTTFTSLSRDRPRVAEDVFGDDDLNEDYGVPIRSMASLPTPGFAPLGADQAAYPCQLEEEDEDGSEDRGNGSSADDDGGEDTGEERTSTDTGRTVPIPIPQRQAQADGTGLLGLRLLPAGHNTPPPLPPPAPPPPQEPLATRARPGILRGNASMRRSGSRGALRFEGALRGKGSMASLAERRERSTPLLRERASTTLREKERASPAGSEALREKSSRGSLRASAGMHVHLAAADSSSRLRGDSLSSAMSNETSSGTLASTNTAASTPALDPDGPRGAFSSDEDDDEDLAPPARGLSIRTVSSHAQAEALVQKAAKEILELNALAEGASLSAQLAAYGETLQLERRFARGEAEAQRLKSPVRPKFELDPAEGDGREEEAERERRREEERRKRERAPERMVPSQSQRSTEQYARRGSKERRSSEAAKERAPGREGAGWPLERSTSLEKEIGAGEVETPKKKSRSPRIRRPHTSDSVASAASGSTGPPRFGHSTTHSSGCLVGVAEGAQEPLHVFRTEQGRRGHHHVTRSTSAQAAPRSESLDGGTRAIIPRGSADSEDGDDGALPHSGRAASTRSPLGQSSSQAQSQSQSPSMPPAGSLFMASSATIDELGTGGRPLKQRFGGGFRSLFGKSR